jgi:NAD(P)H-hydrate epimerase
MKIFTSGQIAEIDKVTLEKQHLSEYDLVARVAKRLFRWLRENIQLKNRRVFLFAGAGNNGNDVISLATMLGGKNIICDLFMMAPDKKKFSYTRKELMEELYLFGTVHMKEVFDISDVPEIPSGALVIDGLFGTGLNKPVEGLYAEVIEKINESSATVVSVDLPSGLMTEIKSSSKHIVRAHHTLTLEFPKLSLFHRENHEYTGTWSVVDIGLDEQTKEETSTPYFMIDSGVVEALLRRRDKYSHKGNYGHGFLIAGSYGMAGSAVLAAKGALRSGLGLLTVHVPRRLYDIMQISVPEAICTLDSSENVFTSCFGRGSFGYNSDAYGTDLDRYSAVAVGPGIGKAPETVNALSDILAKCDAPMVIDADAINIISSHKDMLGMIPENSVLTPHPKEFARIAGEYSDSRDGAEMQMKFSAENKVTVVLKGAHTSVSTPDGKLWFNSTGNPGMATAGSGDVLGGVILGLMTQGMEPGDAAVAGTYIHGLAGDIATSRIGEASLIAGDIVESLGEAFVKASGAALI